MRRRRTKLYPAVGLLIWQFAIVNTLDLGTCSRCNVMTAGDSIMPSAWLNANRCGAMKSYTVVV